MTDSAPEVPSDTPAFALDPVEIRTLAVLIEKCFLTPDIYPLSLNALVTGCNQLTGREPVMRITEAQAQTALDSLISQRWAARRDQAGARVSKYEHLVRMRHSLPQAEQAVLATLMLRGPQTVAEIRARSERMHTFPDNGAVEAALGRLADKYPPMALQLPRLPGTKEARWTHLLGGEPDLEELAQREPSHAAPGGSLAARVTALEAEVQALRDELAAFKRQFE